MSAPTQSQGESSKGKQEDEWKSYAGVPGDWETRQISIIGVVKRFISQLSYGQELTKIAMPSEFLNPYSILEFVSLRYLTRFNMLQEANDHVEPQFRLLHIVRWFLSSLQEAKMYKKPYNPVVCETHRCLIETANGETQFVGEQVTHHPPVSALYVENKEAGVSLQGNISFGVKFWLNSVTINTSGFISIKFAKHANEEYTFSKALPDLYLKNVVFGTRRMRWQNTIEIVCKQTNCEAEITFGESGSEETVKGKIKRDGEVVLTFDGSIDTEICHRSVDDDDETVLVSSNEDKKGRVIIPHQDDAYPSIKVWGDVSRNIVTNNMTEADKAKQLVEEEQRTRTRAGEDEKTERKYFIKNADTGKWVYKEGTLDSK